MIEFDALSVSFERRDDSIAALRECTFRVAPGEAVALVGESGSGKTTAARAALGAIGASGKIEGGAVRVVGVNPFEISPTALNQLRRSRLGYVPQNPGAALNPVRRIERQISEMIDDESHGTVADLLERVQLPNNVRRRYPHQLSGGQQQRVGLAIAIANRPDVLILDEPTTGLDVGVQVEILSLFRSLVDDGIAVLYVTHDLAAAALVADRVVVLYAGEVLETGPLEQVYSAPQHPYAEALLAAVPSIVGRSHLEKIPGVMLSGRYRKGVCVFHNRCRYVVDECRLEGPPLVDNANGAVRCFRASELDLNGVLQPGTPVAEQTQIAATDSPTAESPLTTENVALSVHDVWVRYRTAPADQPNAVQGVSLAVPAGSTLALVGESGSGKTSVARVIAGLVTQQSGVVRLGESELPTHFTRRSRDELRSIQYVFQNSTLALNPRRTVGSSLVAPLNAFFDLDPATRDARIDELLEMVALPRRVLESRPGQLSGGEQQRVAIARALAANPKVLICDEVVSALDVSVQAAVVELLGELQAKTGVSILFISHDLGVVRALADETAVMRHGVIVETALTDDIFRRPRAEYTQELLAAVPDVGRALGLEPTAGDGIHRESSAEALLSTPNSEAKSS